MDSATFISKRVDALRDHSQEFYDLNPDISNDFDSWSALKLILHSAAVKMYTSVHKNQGTGDIFYIDALAGSGVSTYNEGRCFAGSPLVAARAAQEPFTKMFFVDSEEDHCNALRERLNYAFSLPGYTEPNDFEVIEGNSNKEIGSIIEEIQDTGSYKDRFNYYCFIDNQGLDVEWSSIEELTPTPYGDLLINLPTAHAIGRNANQSNMDALGRFYGVDIEGATCGQATREELKELYCRRLADQDRSVQESTKVQTNIGSFYYDLLYATRETGGGNGYMEVISYVKQFIESVHSGHVDRMIDVLDGNQSAIQSFLPDEPIDDELPDDGEDDEQSGLSEFL